MANKRHFRFARKGWGIVIAFLAVSMGTVGFTSIADASVAPHAIENVSIAAATTSIVDMPIWVGQTNGYFAQHNLNVKFVALTASTELTGLLSGSVQFLSQTTADFLTDRAQSDPIESVADITRGSPAGVLVNTQFAQAHGLTSKTPLKTVVQDLIGSTAVASSANTAAEMRIFTEEYGVQPSQYTIASVSSISGVEAAIEKNQAQWMLTAEPTPLELQAEGLGVQVASSGTIYELEPERYGMGQTLVVTDSFANADPGIMREMVAGISASVQYISHHEKQVLDVAQTNLPGIARSVLSRSFALIDFPSTSKENPNVWRTSIAFAVKEDVIKPGLKVVENVDWTNKYF